MTVPLTEHEATVRQAVSTVVHSIIVKECGASGHLPSRYVGGGGFVSCDCGLLSWTYVPRHDAGTAKHRPDDVVYRPRHAKDAHTAWATGWVPASHVGRGRKL